MDLWTPPHPRPAMAPGGRHGEKSPYVWGPTAALGVYLARPLGCRDFAASTVPAGFCRQWACRPPLWSHCGHSLREAGGEGRQEARGLTDGRRAVDTHPVLTRSASAFPGLAGLAG